MRALSRRTIMFAAVGLALVAAAALAITLSGSERAGVVISDVTETVIVSASAVAILVSAARFGRGPLRRNWMLVGIGVAAYAIGDAVWTWIEVIRSLEVPYPGLPDLFYLAEYAFLGSGIAMAGLAYRGLVPVRKNALIGIGVTLALAVALWFGFISPYVVGGEWNAESVLSAGYPLADVILLFGPALFALLVVRQLGGGRLGWPWWAVGFGALALAVSDSVYSYLTALDVYRSGMPVDYGWMLAHIAIAIGALIADDIAHPVAAARDRAKAA